MRLAAATPRQVRFVAERMRARDVAEFLPLSYATTADGLVDELVERFGEHPEVLCALDAGYLPAAIGGLIQNRPGVASLLFFATDSFPSIAAALTRAIRNDIFPRYRARGIHRIDCVSIEDYDDAHRWIEVLGLDRGEPLRGYGKGGETYLQFAWTAAGIGRRNGVSSAHPEKRGSRGAAHAEYDRLGVRGAS